MMTTIQNDIPKARINHKLAYLLLGFAVSILIRVLIGSPDIGASALAGLVFAACLVVLAGAEKPITTATLQTFGWGVLGTVVVFVPIAIFQADSISMHARPAGNYAIWSLVVTVVAVAEEYFLRGAFYESINLKYGVFVAIIVGAVAFAGLHVPLYGWNIVPLDFVVGIWLGTLRYYSGSWTSPAVTHVAADLGAWWII